MNKQLKGKIIENFGTQFEFARVIGAHEAYVSMVVRGHRSLNFTERKKWAAVLNADERIFLQEAH